MATVEELSQQIRQLPPSEADELVARLLSQSRGNWLFGVDASPDVCGGEARIVRTRIPVWVLEQMRRLGTSEAEILRAYPTLRAADLVNAWAYVDAHPEEIDRQIRDNEEA